MKTKSGIYVEVAEQPGGIDVTVQHDVQHDGTPEISASLLFRVICGLAENLPPKDAVLGSVLAGPRPGWSLALKPLGAKRVADGLKPISSILTVEEARTLHGLLGSARRWAEHPPMLTYVEGEGGFVGRIPLSPVGRLTRSHVTRYDLSALRAAPCASPETDASKGDPDLRWARKMLCRTSPERWEPCASDADGAVLVVLP